MLPILFIVLLLEGFITISVEVLTIRQLLPFFGGSVLITSIIIGVFLLFLALGYWRGGVYKHDFLKQLTRNFSLSLLWIGIGLSYSFIAVFYYVSAYQIHMPFLLSLTVYLLLVLAPIVYWLGQTVPITTNLFNQDQRVSRISGSALFLSTIGSFLGAIVTSLVFFQYLGVAYTVAINCILLLLLVMLLQRQLAFAPCKWIMLIVAMVFILFLNINVERLHFVRTNNYGNYRVLTTPDFTRILQINESSSSSIGEDKRAFPYIEFIRKILFTDFKLENKDILVIGAGGFTLTAKGAHHNKVTYVDIDPDIKSLAEQHFLRDNIKGHFIGMDARRYLMQTDRQYDVILSDVYSHQATIPPSLLTVEYFQRLKRHLRKDGFMIANIIANPTFDDAFSQRVYNTILRVFPFCAVTPLNWEYPLTNVIYICPNRQADMSIYRDDLSSSTTDFFKSAYLR